jgi:hypothetical protein
LETGRVPVWNIHTVLTETRVLAPALRRHADARLGDQLPGMSWSEATQAAAGSWPTSTRRRRTGEPRPRSRNGRSS